jgi:hypothetical protein
MGSGGPIAEPTRLNIFNMSPGMREKLMKQKNRKKATSPLKFPGTPSSSKAAPGNLTTKAIPQRRGG